MFIFRIIPHAIISSLLLMVASSIQAIPIKFEFTGTVTNKVLSYGEIIDVPLNARKWRGKTVTGEMIIDIEGLETNPDQSPEQVYYSSWYGNNASDWLSFTLTNPDGSTYSFPGGYDPLPEVDVDGSDAYLVDSFYNGTQFYVGRNYSNSRSVPRQGLSLRMQAQGENAKQAITSMDFNTVEFHPEFANWENYGIVEYHHDDGKKFNYYFNINSIKRVSVPEPASWLMILGGFIGLLVYRQRALKK